MYVGDLEHEPGRALDARRRCGADRHRDPDLLERRARGGGARPRRAGHEGARAGGYQSLDLALSRGRGSAGYRALD